MRPARVPPVVPPIVIGPRLGAGGFGQVFRGHHPGLDVDVAVKVIEVADGDAVAAEHALKEARLMARLDHPNLLRILDAKWVDEELVLVLELMDGGSLENEGPLPADECLAVARQLLSGLQALHDAGILHRDVKPANCLRRANDGRVKLADLGIALQHPDRTVRLEEATGTLPFMAPELFEQPAVYSPQSDLYALGLTLAAIALEDPPFPRTDMHGLIDWIHRGARPRIQALRPDLAPSLAHAIERMMSPSRALRPRSAADVLLELAEPPHDAHVPAAGETSLRIGSWILGDEVYRSSNWLAHTAVHRVSGARARVARLQPTGPLRDATPLILAAAERASRLDHPVLLPVLDWGRVEGRAWVATSPRGRALDEIVAASGPFSEQNALETAFDIAQALVYLHSASLVYQMVEPGSVLAAGESIRVLLSWPVYCVKAGTRAVDADGRRHRVASKRFAAPEFQQAAATIEPSVDLYGLGEVLYFLLCGRSSREARTAAHGAGDLDPRRFDPHVSDATARLTMRLLASDPQDRPDAEMAHATLRRLSSRG